MINVNNILYIFNSLVREKYLKTTQTERSSKDYELADHLFVLLSQLLTSAELLADHIVTLDFDEYDDCIGDYQKEDKSDIVLNVDGIKYSFDTMCAIVEFSKNYTFSTLRRRYKQIKHKEQLRRIKQYVNAQGTKKNKSSNVLMTLFTWNLFVLENAVCLYTIPI